MRGKDTEVSANGNPAGITPAHAGKRHASCPSPQPREDHPRPCGEKANLYVYHQMPSGSPPPMRGKDMPYLSSSSFTGITPAHAGKSSCSPSNSSFCQDHPRPCGEKIENVLHLLINIGSPPPMRGKEALRNSRTRSLRITPAHAGKSDTVITQTETEEDHPRPCGEKVSLFHSVLL